MNLKLKRAPNPIAYASSKPEFSDEFLGIGKILLEFLALRVLPRLACLTSLI